MWKKMTEAWVWWVSLISFGLSFGLAHLFVRLLGWRWTYLVDAPLDASYSIVSFTLMFAVILQFVALFGGVLLAAHASTR